MLFSNKKIARFGSPYHIFILACVISKLRYRSNAPQFLISHFSFLRSAQSRKRVPSFFALAALPSSLKLQRDKPLSPHEWVPKTYGCKNYLSSLLLQRSKQVTGSPCLILFSNKKMARFESPYHIYTSIKLYILASYQN